MAKLSTAGLSNWYQCGHCGMWHAGVCPRIKSIDYYPDGQVKHVEYHEPWSPYAYPNTSSYPPLPGRG